MQPAEQDVKLRLLQAAKKLFARQGFDGTSIRQICEEAGANVALISYHFGGKDKILQALIESVYTQPMVSEYLGKKLEPVEGLRTFVREITLFRLREPDIVQLFQQELLLNRPRLRDLQEKKFPVWIKLKELLEEGRAQGKFHFRSSDLAFSFIVRLLLDSKNENFKPLMTEKELTPEQQIEEMTDFILNGLKYKPN